MKIDHASGTSVETDKLPDVDAILMEESQKLHTLFAKYNRQLFLVGEMIAAEGAVPSTGCIFFHIGEPGISKKPEEFAKAMNTYYGRIDGYIRGISNSTLGIGRIPPPLVEPYNKPSEV